MWRRRCEFSLLSLQQLVVRDYLRQAMVRVGSATTVIFGGTGLAQEPIGIAMIAPGNTVYKTPMSSSSSSVTRHRLNQLVPFQVSISRFKSERGLFS